MAKTFDLIRWLRDVMDWQLVPRERAFTPAFDVSESSTRYQLKADLPGIRRSDIDIELGNGALEISGKRDVEGAAADETRHASERGSGTFHRTFALPDGLDTARADIAIEDGVLVVSIPKRIEQVATPR